MKRLLEILDKYLKYYLLIGFVVVASALVLLAKRVYKIESQMANLPVVSTQTADKEIIASSEDVCGKDCKKTINEIVGNAVSTISATTKTIIKTQEVSLPIQSRVAYLALPGPITTTSTDWVDAVGTDVYLDLTGSYGKEATATWEAFISIASANLTAYARLFDVTHGIAVNGSEISSANVTLAPVSSGNISLWAGRNLYRVQIKSLNGFLVTFGSGRIKINY